MILDRLRLPLFIAAAIVWLVIVGMEFGSKLIPSQVDSALVTAQANTELQEMGLNASLRSSAGSQIVAKAADADKPPGLAIPDLALLDGLVLYIVLLMGLSRIIQDRVQGRVQGVITLIASILVILAAVVLFFRTLTEVLLMLGLAFSVPFGLIAYLAIWGFFDKGSAAVILACSMLFKLVFLFLLFLAHQRFFRILSLMLLVGTSLLGNFIITLLHGIVPGIFVSITDGIGALVLLVVVVIWSVVFLVGSIISITRAA